MTVDPLDAWALAESSARQRRRYRETRRANDAKRAEAAAHAAVLAHPEQFPPGHPLRDRALAAGLDIEAAP